MNALQITLLSAVALGFAANANAAPYITNFDPPAYFGNSSLSGQQGWDTNNYSDNGTPGNPLDDLGQSDSVGELAGYSTSASDFWGLLGGVIGFAPVVNTSYLFVPLNLVGESQAVFNVRFGIISSQLPQTEEDTFGWTFRNSVGNQLLRVAFIPDINQGGQLAVRVFDSANSELAGSGSFDIAYDSQYDLSVNVSGAGIVSVSIDDLLANPPAQIINNQPAAGAIPSAISNIAATWTLADTTSFPNGERPNYGSNSLVFDNYSVIPEPSSAFLLIFSSLFLTLRRRQPRP